MVLGEVRRPVAEKIQNENNINKIEIERYLAEIQYVIQVKLMRSEKYLTFFTERKKAGNDRLPLPKMDRLASNSGQLLTLRETWLWYTLNYGVRKAVLAKRYSLFVIFGYSNKNGGYLHLIFFLF